MSAPTMSTISSRFSYGGPGVHADRNGEEPRRCCFAQHSGARRLTRRRESGTLPNKARTAGQRTRRGAECREPVDNCGGFAGGTLGRRNRKPQLDDDTTDANKRNALKALESGGSRHDAAKAADVCQDVGRLAAARRSSLRN